MNKFTLLFSTLPIALGGLCGCRSAANPLQAERTPTTTPVVRRLAGANNTNEIARVELGSLTWIAYTYGFQTRFTDAVATTTNDFTSPIVCDLYQNVTPSQGWITNTIHLSVDHYLRVNDPNYTDLATFKEHISGHYLYYEPVEGSETPSVYDEGFSSGYTTGYDQGRSQGYTEGYDAGVAQATGELVLNETYTGLYAFYNQYYLSHWAYDIEAGYITTLDHFFIKFSAENYELDLYFYEMDGEGETFSGAYEIFAFVEANGTTMNDMTKVGQLSGYAIADEDYSSSWIYQFNPTTFSFTTIKQSANEVAPINFGRQMTLHHYANLNGAKNFIIGKGNQYAEGYNAGHQDTIEATEAFNNVFTIFGKAFSAVSSFLNLNIGPFKMWYFFLMPIIVALFILVLRLVKH